jgi:hypothetical protein
MARRTSGSVPSYRFHKARACAVVTIDGKDHYLGPYNSCESRDKYDRLTVQEGRDTGKTVPGIYAFHEGRLMLCINIFGDPMHRPSEFKSYDRDGVGFATLKRIAAE